MSPGYYPENSPAMAMHFLTSLKFWFILSDTLGVGGVRHENGYENRINPEHRIIFAAAWIKLHLQIGCVYDEALARILSVTQRGHKQDEEIFLAYCLL